MPLARYLGEAVFDPAAIQAMTNAFAMVCESLGLNPSEDAVTQLVARKVIDIGQTGERDPKKIHDLVLLALKNSDQQIG